MAASRDGLLFRPSWHDRLITNLSVGREFSRFALAPDLATLFRKFRSLRRDTPSVIDPSQNPTPQVCAIGVATFQKGEPNRLELS